MVLLTNMMLLAQHHYEAHGDVEPLIQAVNRILDVSQAAIPPFFIAGALSAYHAIYNENPANRWAVDDAIAFMPPELLEKLTPENATAHARATLILSAMGQLTGFEGYLGQALQVRDHLLKSQFLTGLELAHEKINQAQDISKYLEMTDPEPTQCLALSSEAVRLAREGCAEAGKGGERPDAQAINLECLASCLRGHTELSPTTDSSLLREAEDAAGQALGLVQRGGAAWARHGGVRVDVLTELLALDPDTWADTFEKACLDLIASKHASPSANWNYGQWIANKSPSRLSEGLHYMLTGAHEYASPTFRIDKLVEVLAATQAASKELGEQDLESLFLRLVASLLEDFRAALWSPLGKQYNQAIASDFAWIGALWADLALTRDRDWQVALSALGIVANALWAMDSSVSDEFDAADSAVLRDPYRDFRTSIHNSKPPEIRPYEKVSAGPTLVVLVPGSTVGWAIVRTGATEACVVELPGFSISEVQRAATAFHTEIDKSRVGRGSRPGLAPMVHAWMEKAILEPLMDSQAIFEEWVVWCPTGPSMGLPLQTLATTSVPLMSFTSDPMFTPADLATHAFTHKRPAAGFLGWSKYYSPTWPDLGGVLREAAAYQTEIPAGLCHVDEPLHAIHADGFDILHFACHGSGAGANGESTLRLGRDDLDVSMLVRKFRGHRSLVVLNACLTAEPSPVLSDQNLTVVKAFQIAGARSVIGALWVVSDGSLAHPLPELLVSNFYGSLLNEDRYCLCERCVITALTGFTTAVASRGVGWKHTANWVHLIGTPPR